MSLLRRVAARLSRRPRTPHRHEDAATLALKGERAARRYLERRGYLTLEERYRTRQGEIDLVMQDGEAIVFVEVKTRRTDRFGSPAEAVTAEKERHLAATGHTWLKARRLTHRAFRHDVVAVTYDGRFPRITHHRGALTQGTMKG